MENIDANRLMPFGQELKNILEHTSIKDTERRHLLRNRGVFFNSYNEENTMPIFISSLLSPSELNYLKEKLQDKEDKPKSSTSTIELKSELDINKILPDNFNLSEINKTSTNYPKSEIVDKPEFNTIDKNPNNVSIPFSIITTDINKDWYRTKNKYEGEVEIIKTGNSVLFKTKTTSPETKEVADNIINHLEKYWKNNDYMNPQEKIQKIIFKNFTNEKRFNFFLSLTEDTDIFNCIKINFFIIAPDENEDLPEIINWLETGKIHELSMKGDILQNIHFLKDKTLHKYIEIFEMEINCNFTIPIAKGKCKISFGFTDYLKKRGRKTEFSIKIVDINQENEYSKISKYLIEKQLLNEFEKNKINKYKLLQTFIPTNVQTTTTQISNKSTSQKSLFV